jgi:hypothetical protein
MPRWWAGVTAAGLWLVVMTLTWRLPMIPPGEVVQHRTWKQILGLDALGLLVHRDHRVVFLTAGFVLRAAGGVFIRTPRASCMILGCSIFSAVISLGQTTEVLVMLLLAGVMARFRLKWVFMSGIAICVVRYSFNTFNTLPSVMFGTFLHGFAYTLYFITTQIYLEERNRSEMAGACAGAAGHADGRRGQSGRLSRRRLVVCGLHGQQDYQLVALLVGGDGADCGGVRVLRRGVPGAGGEGIEKK